MAEEGGGDFNIRAWNVDTFDGRVKRVYVARAWWALQRGDIKPFLRFDITLDDNTKYGFACFPRRTDSYPTAKIIRRELLRESAVRALEAGEIDFDELPESKE